MRAPVDQAKLRRLGRELGHRARGPGRIYLVGGASALLDDVRSMLERGLVSTAELGAAATPQNFECPPP